MLHRMLHLKLKYFIIYFFLEIYQNINNDFFFHRLKKNKVTVQEIQINEAWQKDLSETLSVPSYFFIPKEIFKVQVH